MVRWILIVGAEAAVEESNTVLAGKSGSRVRSEG